MKFLHISDLHLGKRVHGFSMLEEQKYILNRILEIAENEKAEGVFLAGDIYDKLYPSAEAVALFDWFLVSLSKAQIKVFVISGNHDSPERIAFLGELTQQAGVYLSPVYRGKAQEVVLEDAYGKLHIYLLPFVKSVHVRHFFPEEKIADDTQAMEVVIKQMQLCRAERNILVAHQFAAGASRSDSEEISVGGLDAVDGSVYADFDYVALGHIHRPQRIGLDRIRYSGSPLKYSFSEWKDTKSVLLVEMREKGNCQIRDIALSPLHDMTKIRGTFEQVIHPENFPHADRESYLHITLLDEQDIPDAFRRLTHVYPNLMQMEYDNLRTAERKQLQIRRELAGIAPEEIFAQLYETMNNQPLLEVQRKYLQEKIEAIWKGEAT